MDEGSIFNPTLNNIGKLSELCKLVRKDKEGNKINRERIKRKSGSLGLRKPLYLTTEEMLFKCKESGKIYLYIKPNASVMRQAFLLELSDKPILESMDEN